MMTYIFQLALDSELFISVFEGIISLIALSVDVIKEIEK